MYAHRGVLRGQEGIWGVDAYSDQTQLTPPKKNYLSRAPELVPSKQVLQCTQPMVFKCQVSCAYLISLRFKKWIRNVQSTLRSV